MASLGHNELKNIDKVMNSQNTSIILLLQAYYSYRLSIMNIFEKNNINGLP